LLYNIFLFKGKKLKDLEDLNIFSYPKEVVNVKNKIMVNNILKSHEQGNSIENGTCRIIKYKNSKDVIIDKPVAQYLNDFNIYTSCIDKSIIIGLIFEEDDNPYDYKEIFEEVLCELLSNGSGSNFDDELEIDNFLISMFIDIRRYGDEIIEKPPEIELLYQREEFYKVFLFGIDEVGKTSFVRWLKTGEFNENYFTPTRKFNIEYVKTEDKGLLAIWDMPGQRNFRRKWLIGLQDSNVIVYMIDIANQRRFEESKKEIWNILHNPELNGVPLLILGNKVDLVTTPNNQSESQIQKLKEEIFTYFDFNEIHSRDWEFLFTSVKTNYNIEKTVQTIFELVSKYKLNEE
jgi:small GTP-binding protein